MMQEQPLISLCMIVKDEESTIIRCLESVKFIVDEYCILDTGSTDRTVELIEEFTKKPVARTQFVNFVETKNEALKLATGKYILWMDADEVLKNPCFLKLRIYAEDNVNAVILNKMESDIEYYKYRMWPNLPEIKFNGPYTHEYLEFNIEQILDDKITVYEYPKENKDWEGKFKRDIDLIEKYLKEVDENNSRALFYLAQSYYSLNKYEAINVYKKAIQYGNFDDEINWSYYNLSNFYIKIAEYDQAMEIVDEAIKRFPYRGENIYNKARIYYSIQDWDNAIIWFNFLLQMEKPKVLAFLDSNVHNKEVIREYISMIQFKQFKFLDSLETLSQIENKKHYLINNEKLIKNKSKLKIAMYTGGFVIDINGGMLDNEGIYGTETAYLELAESLAKTNDEVYLFTETQIDHTYKNVKIINYKKYAYYLNEVNFDIIINSRYDIFNTEIPNNPLKILWMHDLFVDENVDKFNFDYIICSTEWHKKFLLSKFHNKIESDKIYVIPLSLNLYHYKNIDVNKKNNYKIVYSSSVDRGLLDYLSYFEDLLKIDPKFELHYFYGLDIAEKIAKLNNSDISKITEILNFYHKKYGKNLINHGRVNKRELAKEKIDASYSIQINNFLETFGLTYIENQTAGVITFSRKLGAIGNTLNENNNFIFIGDVSDNKLYDKIHQKIIELNNNNEYLRELQTKNIEFIKNNFKNWNEISKQWMHFLYKHYDKCRTI
jgi:glycosyltransferase involved in cell wall biosynthesis